MPELRQQWALVKADGAFPENAYSWSWHLAIALLIIPQAFSMGTAPRFFSVKDGREARKSQILATLLYAPTIVVWCLPAFAARLLYSDKVMATDLSKPAESAFAIASINVLPAGISMLVVVTILTAGMSSLCTVLNQNAAMLTQDVYPFLCKLSRQKVREGVAKLVFAKMSTVFSGAVLILIALYCSMQKSMGVFEVMLRVAAMLYLPTSAPMFLGMLIKRTPRWAPFFSIVCGFLASLVSVVYSQLGHPWTFTQLVIIVWVVSHGSFVMTMPFFKWTAEEYKKKVDTFFVTMHTPIQFDKEVGKSEDLSQLKITGFFTVIIGLLILAIMFMADNWRGRVSVLSVSAFIIVVGIILLGIGRKYNSGPKKTKF
jgi:Na+/proline symporter